MGESDKLPGMPASEWHAIEADGMKAYAAEKGDRAFLMEAIARRRLAEREAYREWSLNEFKRLYPGKEPPEDEVELDREVQAGLAKGEK